MLRLAILGLLVLALVSAADAGVGSVGAGMTMNPSAAGSGVAPPTNQHIITEDGDNLVTEAGDQLITEN